MNTASEPLILRSRRHHRALTSPCQGGPGITKSRRWTSSRRVPTWCFGWLRIRTGGRGGSGAAFGFGFCTFVAGLRLKIDRIRFGVLRASLHDCSHFASVALGPTKNGTSAMAEAARKSMLRRVRRFYKSTQGRLLIWPSYLGRGDTTLDVFSGRCVRPSKCHASLQRSTTSCSFTGGGR